MATPFYKTPADVRDFKDPKNYTQWSDNIRNMLDVSLHGDGNTRALGTKYSIKVPQFFIEEVDKPTNPVTQKITWGGFPRRLELKYPDNKEEQYKEADSIARGTRWQDEYLEWFSHRNEEGKLTKIEFTAEGPEYFEALFQWEPDTLVELYRTHISPEVKLEDLKDENGQYNPSNKWNLTQGAMHLNCPPNSLFAEVYLGASATVLREDSHGKPITDATQLINCAQYGVSSRNSDPNIGYQVNTLARQGFKVSIHNPIGLYIDNVQKDAITLDEEGTPVPNIDQYFRLVRGSDEKGLRYVFEVPPGGPDKFVIGDLFVNNAPLKYAGQVAELITINLVGVAYKMDSFEPQYVHCEDSERVAAAALSTVRVAHAPLSTVQVAHAPKAKFTRLHTEE